MSVETSGVARRLSFGCFYSKEEEMRLNRDYPPNQTLAANGGGQSAGRGKIDVAGAMPGIGP